MAIDPASGCGPQPLDPYEIWAVVDYDPATNTGEVKTVHGNEMAAERWRDANPGEGRGYFVMRVPKTWELLETLFGSGPPPIDWNPAPDLPSR